MVDERDALAQARVLLAGLPRPHVAELGRELRRRASPQRSARPEGVRVSVVPGGFWLDVANRGAGAGVLFSPDEWAGFCSSCLALLGDSLLAKTGTSGGGVHDGPPGGVDDAPPGGPPGEPLVEGAG